MRRISKRSLCTFLFTTFILPGAAFAELSINRDEFGVPAIRATTNKELFYGLGYSMARDRIGQMAALLRLANGNSKKDENVFPYNVIIRSRYPNIHSQLNKEIENFGNLEDNITTLPLAVADCMAAGINQFLTDLNSKPSVDGKEAVKNSCYSGPLQKKIRSQLSFGDALDEGEIKQIKLALDHWEFPGKWTRFDIFHVFHNRIMDMFSARNDQLNGLAFYKALESANPNDLERARRLFNTSKWVADPNAATEIPVPNDEEGAKMRKMMAQYRDMMEGAFLESDKSAQCHIYSSATDFVKKVNGRPDQKLAAAEMYPTTASNFWAVAGKSVDPNLKSLLINGPQTGALDPSLFYPINLSSEEGFRYAGTTFPGTFSPLTGQNGNLAFGVTAANNGSSDLFCIDVAMSPNGNYKSAEGLELAQNPDLREIGVTGYYIRGTNWPVVLLDKNENGSKAVAFVKRLSWEGQTIRSFAAGIEASQAKTIKELQKAHDSFGGNLNVVAAHKSGIILFRLTGVIPPRIGTNVDKSKNPFDPMNFLTKFDLRMPIPMSPTKGWRKESPQYYKLNYATDDGAITSWNHKPYLMMQDPDYIHSAWFQWDRSLYIVDALKNTRPSVLSTALTNGVLSLKDVYYGQFKQFLEKLDVNSLNGDQRKALKKILTWNGYRDDANNLTRYDEDRWVNGGQVLFQLWLQEFANLFQIPVLAGEKEAREGLARAWTANFSKLKQPKFSNGTKRKLTFDTSSNIHPIGRIMLNNLHFIFRNVQYADPNAYDIIGGTNSDNINKKTSQKKALMMMATALKMANSQFDKMYSEVKDSNGNIPAAYRSYYGISTRMAEKATTSRRKPTLSIPYFRNRGAQNHIVAFDSREKVTAYNAIPGGVREYRGDKTKFTDNQVPLYRDNDFRPMIDFSLPIGEKPKPQQTLRKGHKIKSKL
ncbi:penicillin acylase family protein [Sneathiella sp. HT1-7]|uniref:penicillin acylase family protein n=1 Tax=Sneathiella sp. HT1-7 TaxID=2887192 RepID=UPI001D146B03|nr:penicillin acylase family protein [Sneathiella sp. HT1-7]MCC3306385.1 penicillin acylase family protein [Sneathiella sp. HT1-7]